VRAMTAGTNGYLTGARTPLVALVRDPNDGPEMNHPNPIQNIFAPYGLSPALTDEQEALLGCGPFYGTNCDIHGVDLMNMEASATIQSWPVFEGTFTDARAGGGTFFTTDKSRAQPGTTGFQGGPVCTRVEGGRTYILPGCRGPGDIGYDINVDGSTFGEDNFGLPGAYQRVHPFTGQEFSSEMAVLSWNTLMVFAALSLPADPENPQDTEFAPNDPFRTTACSFAAPNYCSNVQAYDSVIGARRSSIRAGGNGQFGRRDFVWHGGGDLAIRFEKRNVLGFSMDFAEDFTKSNWGMEFTWIEGLPFSDSNSWDATSKADTYNLTLSVDRPTFVNFLNQNRTLFINSQWFFQWVHGFERGFTSNGPFNMLATFTITTGYFQDRLLPGFTIVYDFGSQSGAGLANVTYRFTENFSATVGMAGFFGHYQSKTPALWSTGVGGNRVGRSAYQLQVENGLSPVRERDELYLSLRYTF
jgi:hypothetical protein